MNVINQIISADDFTFYSDYFVNAALSGIYSARSVYSTIATLSQVRIRSIPILDNAVQSRNILDGELRDAYEYIFSSALSTNPMSVAFQGLSDHIQKYAGQSVDEFLTDNHLTVTSTYAKLSQLLGDTIRVENIS